MPEDAERRKKQSNPNSPPARGARISLRLAHPNFTNQTFACGRREELVCFLAPEFPRFSSFPLRLQKFAFAYSALLCNLPAYYLADIPHPTTSNITLHTTTTNNFSPISHNNSDLFSIAITTYPLRPDERRSTTHLIHSPITRPTRSIRRGSDIIHLLP